MARPVSTGGRYHQRSVALPPMYEAIAIAAVSDDKVQPAYTAARSRSTSTELMNNGTSTIAITRPAPTTKFTNSAARRLRPWNRRGSKSGFARRGVPATRSRSRRASATRYSQRRSVVPPVSSSSPLTLWISAEPSSATLRVTRATVSSVAPNQLTAAALFGPVVTLECPPRRGEAGDRQRDVEPELPLPRQEPHQHRAVQRAPHPPHRLDRSERAERPGALALGIHVADDGECDGHHRPAADRGQHATGQEPAERRVERGRQRDQDRADQEQQVGGDEGASAAEHVAEPSGDRHHRHERDQVGVDDPRCVVEPVGQHQPEVADDRAQHRGDDREVVCRDEHAEPDDRQDRGR